MDADNLISDNYISEAAKILDKNPAVKLVSSEAEYIGDKSGRWKFERFSINLLCRRNLVDNCSMYPINNGISNVFRYNYVYGWQVSEFSTQGLKYSFTSGR